MAKSMKQMLLLSKIEAVPGTDAVPTAPLNAILCRGLAPEQITAEQVPRNLIRGTKGNSPKLVVGVHRRFTCEVELAGSGDPGVAPAWSPLIRSCGFSETIVEDTSVTYQPISGDVPATHYIYLDGILYKVVRALGTVVFNLTAKGIPVMQFTFIGEYVAPTDVTMPTDADFSKFLAPLTVGKVNTPTFTLHGVSACMQSFNIDVANQLTYRELVNCAGARSPDRQPTASAVIELTSVAQKNWAEIIRTGAPGTAQIVHGLTPGNIVTIDLPNTQLDGAPIQDDSGIAMQNVSMSVNPDEGNDEIVITLT